MTRDPIAVHEETERGDAAEIIQTHDFLSLPVIDKAGRLVGAVRVDDLLDAALSKVGAGFLNQGGVAGKIAARLPYFQTSMVKVVRSRITWLVLLFVAETATGTVLRHFEDELAKVVALSFFIPLLIGTGGNAGSQTVSTIIRALALGEVRLRDALRVLAKEAATGVVLGHPARRHRLRPRAALGRGLRPRGLRRRHGARRLHLGQHGRRADPARRAAGADRSDRRLGAAHHDAGRRLGPLHLPHHRPSARRPIEVIIRPEIGTDIDRETSPHASGSSDTRNSVSPLTSWRLTVITSVAPSILTAPKYCLPSVGGRFCFMPAVTLW